jgi:HAE1 family hydrophobic/amphiphilic exporter-1
MFRLARFSLANRAMVALVTVLIAGLGVFSMTQLKQELIPSIELPQTTVVTISPGASPEVVDEQISQPLSNSISSLDGVEQVVATSSSGMSMVSIAYAYGTDADEFRTSVQGAIDALTTLPADAEPELVAGSTADLPIVFLTASSADATPSELTDALTDVVVPRLEGIPGVRGVSVSGAETQRVVITPDAEALAAQGLTAQAIAAALETNGMTIPLGSVDAGGSLVPVQGSSPVDSLDNLGSLPLASTTQPGTVVALSDLADVELVAEERTSITRMNGDEALSLSITAAPDGDVVAISHGVQEAIDELTADPAGLDLTIVFDQAPFIEESIQHLATEGLLGLLFAILVILVFLLSARSTLVTGISIPLSVLVTFPV